MKRRSVHRSHGVKVVGRRGRRKRMTTIHWLIGCVMGWWMGMSNFLDVVGHDGLREVGEDALKRES